MSSFQLWNSHAPPLVTWSWVGFFPLQTDLIKAHCFLHRPTLLHKMEMKEVRSAPPSDYQELQLNRYIIVLNVFLYKNVIYGFSFLQQSIVDCSYPCQKCGQKRILIKLKCKSLYRCFVKILFVGCEFFIHLSIHQEYNRDYFPI
jgi:hypothetical protein